MNALLAIKTPYIYESRMEYKNYISLGLSENLISCLKKMLQNSKINISWYVWEQVVD